mgnify:CR=1 FL=1
MEKQRAFGRRNLLRGLGAGGLLFAPFARSLRAASPAGTQPSFLAFFTPNGHVRAEFGATGSGANCVLKPSLAALASFQSQLSILSKIDNPGASEKHSHEDITRILTSRKGSDIYRGYGPSIDWVVARHFGGRPLTLSALYDEPPNYRTKLSWKESGVLDPHVDSARAIYSELFAILTPSQTPQEVDHTLAQSSSVLDYVLEDLQLLRGRVNGLERVKLDNHMDAIRQLENKLGGARPQNTPLCATSELESRVQQGLSGNDGARLQSEIELKLDLITMAFACGLSHSATLLCQPGTAGLNMIGGSGNHHDISHDGVFNLGNDQDARAVWVKIDRWYADRFAYLLKRASDLMLLESCVIAWVSEICESHDQKGFVIPVAGGSGLGMRHGHHYDAGDTLSNLWVSVQNAMGIAADQFGEQSSGGIPGLFSASA